MCAQWIKMENYIVYFSHESENKTQQQQKKKKEEK